MREIEFRLWNIKEKKMYYSDNDEDGWLMDISNPKQICRWDSTISRDGIFLQYTGFEDKNNKKIFDGDILNLKDINGDYSIVIWDDDLGGWFTKNNNDFCDLVPVCRNANKYSIVGNIYENPESNPFRKGKIK